MRPEPLPLSWDDAPAFCFWWALGSGAGFVLGALLVLITPLDIVSPWAGIPVVVGGVLGWKVWWWARNPPAD